MGGFLLWRLRSSVSLPSVLAPACAGVVLVAIVAAVILAWRARRRRLGWDGGALSLILAGLPASSAPTQSPASGYEMGTAGAGDSRASGVDPYSGHNFGGSSPDWVDEEPEDNEDAWQLTGR